MLRGRYVPNVCSAGAPSSARALELIRAGLAALAADDIGARDAPELGEECADIMRAVGELQMQAARRLARFDAARGPARDHTHSVAGWLGLRCRLRPWEAGQLAMTARRLHLLGDTVAAFTAGEIEFGDVETIAEGIDRAADTMTDDWPPERIAAAAQPILLEAAPRVTPGQLRKVACRVAIALDGDSTERRRRQIDRQAFLNIGQTISGVGVLRGELGAADLAIVEKTIDAFGPLPHPDRPRWANAAGKRRLQGLVTACQVALRAAGRHGYRERGGAPVRVHVIVSAATVDPHVPATQAPPGRTEYGTVLSAAEVREMIERHRARVTEITLGPDGRVADRFTADGQPLNWGRTRRFFTPAQRDVFLAVYATCAAEGCDRPPAWADIDHKQAWADGGRTDLDNGQPLCRWHNRHKEHLRQRADGSPRRPDPESPGGPTSPGSHPGPPGPQSRSRPGDPASGSGPAAVAPRPEPTDRDPGPDTAGPGPGDPPPPDT